MCMCVGESWTDGKSQDLTSAGHDLELAFDHTAAHLHDLVDKCEAEAEAEQVCSRLLQSICCRQFGHFCLVVSTADLHDYLMHVFSC